MWYQHDGVINHCGWLWGPSGVEVGLSVKSLVRLVKPGSGKSCIERNSHGSNSDSMPVC